MAEKKENKKLTPYQEEVLKCAKQIREYKIIAEANIVAILYKQPELIFDYTLQLEDFSENTWRVYWQIANDIIVVEKKSVLDDMTVGLYLEKHQKLKKEYEDYGGYETIDKAKEYVNINNMDGYVKELYKWKTVLEMLKNGFSDSIVSSNTYPVNKKVVDSGYSYIKKNIKPDNNKNIYCYIQSNYIAFNTDINITDIVDLSNCITSLF